MKRLLRSSKYWLAISGTIAGLLAWKFTEGNVTVTSIIIGLFGGGIVGTAAEDMMRKSIGGGGVSDPTGDN